jgi:hypothetical protein
MARRASGDADGPAAAAAADGVVLLVLLLLLVVAEATAEFVTEILPCCLGCRAILSRGGFTESEREESDPESGIGGSGLL